MPNVLQTADLLLEKVLYQLKLTSTFLAPGVSNREFEEEYIWRNNGGYFPGNSLRYRLPNMFNIQSGTTMTAQGVSELYGTITLGSIKGFLLNFTSDEATTKIALDGESWLERALIPMTNTLNASVNGQVADAAFEKVFFHVGDASANFTTLTPFYQARALLSKFGAQVGGYNCYSAVSEDVRAQLAPSLLANFTPSINEEIYKHGRLGNINGIDVFTEPQVRRHISATGLTGMTVKVRTASTSGDTTIALKGLTPGTIITKGELFTIADVNMLDMTKTNTGVALQGIVTADSAAADGSGFTTITVSVYRKGLIHDTANPNYWMDKQLAVDMVVTFTGSYLANLVWFSPALNIATPPMRVLNQGAVSTIKMDPETKLAIRYSAQDSVATSSHNERLDIWPGVAWEGEMACFIVSKI